MNHFWIPLKTVIGAWYSEVMTLQVWVINLQFEQSMKLLPPDLIPSSINLEKSRTVPECLTHDHPIWTQMLLLPVKTTTNFWKDDILCSPLAKWVGTRESSGVWTVGEQHVFIPERNVSWESTVCSHTCVKDTVLRSTHYESWLL